MAAPTDFNLSKNVKAARRLLKTYVNVSSSGDDEWELLGKGVEDSAIELNAETEDTTDITGANESSVTGWKPSQSFDPMTVRGGSKLAFKLHDIWMNNTPELLSQFKVLTVYSYVGEESTGYDSDVQEGCTINIEKIGGSAYVDMPITISYSNKKTRGKTKFTGETPTFTADDAA